MLGIFKYAFWPSVSLWRNIYLDLTIFQFCFFFLSCMSYLYSLEINPLWIALFANIFSHSVCCLLLLFLVSSTMQKLVSLIRSHLFILVFIFITLNCWVAQSCLTVCDPMVCSMPGFPVLHYLPEFNQTHVQMPSNHLILCHPFSCLQSFPGSESISVLFFRLFASGGQCIGASSSVLPMNFQDWFPLGLTDLISLQSKGLSRVFSSSRIRKHQIFGIQPSLWSNSRISMWLLEKPQFLLYGPMLAKWCLCFLIRCLGFP